MNKKRIPEILLCALLTICVTSSIVWVFYNKIVGVQESPLVDASKPNTTPNGERLKVVGARGDSITATKITLVDIDGNTTLTIHAGPPATLEIKDSNGKTKVIDLAKLASSRWLQLPPE